MAVTAKAVANRLLDLATKQGRTIDPLQMQKLVYLVEGWCLGAADRSMFADPIEAWDYGPVVPDLYYALRRFGASPIQGELLDYDYASESIVRADGAFDPEEAAIVETVWDIYGALSGPQLINLTHQPGSPWDMTRKNNRGERNARIDRDTIKHWFVEQLQPEDKEAA